MSVSRVTDVHTEREPTPCKHISVEIVYMVSCQQAGDSSTQQLNYLSLVSRYISELWVDINSYVTDWPATGQEPPAGGTVSKADADPSRVDCGVDHTSSPHWAADCFH